MKIRLYLLAARRTVLFLSKDYSKSVYMYTLQQRYLSFAIVSLLILKPHSWLRSLSGNVGATVLKKKGLAASAEMACGRNMVKAG